MPSPLPPVGTRGIYTLASPWSTPPATLFTCVAIRRFVDIENLGTSVYDTYYRPFELSEATYRTDRSNDEAIVTLTSATTAPIYVPSSYIVSFPDQTFRNYQHVVLSCSLGPLPDYIDLTFAKQELARVVSDVVGIEPEVNVGVAPLEGPVTPEEHDVLEVARQSRINNRTTTYARLLDAEQTQQQLLQRLAICEQILRDNNLIPE